jgi:hypothetical protein
MAPILPQLLVAAMLLFNSTATAFGQDREEARREWGTLYNGRTDFDVSDAALLPSTLALAAKESGCRYEEDIKDTPVRFVSLEGHRLVIVFCRGIAVGSHQVFDVRNVMKPRLVEFPFLAQPDGFGTTARPGWITWEKGAAVFQAETGSDDSFARVRHTYRLDRGTGSFVIVRVEFTPDRGTKDAWTTIWDAPKWSLPAQPR